MKPGLITLADLPDLAAGKNHTTIVVARLDNNLRDDRYGRFKITQADVDGWQRNLAGAFGGRVSIDWDHSSDRGQGTRAAAWITALHQDGKLIKADVEFTPKGAKAVRNGDYKYISPTFVNDYKDEHGQSQGRALIGAALTNRPVLRKDMPTLSLSRDRFDGVATPRKRKSKVRTMSKKAKAKQTLSRKDTELVADAIDAAWRRDPPVYGAAERRQREQGLEPNSFVTLAECAPDVLKNLKQKLSPDTVMTLAAYAPAGVQYAGTIDWQPPAAEAGRVPHGLDDSGQALHALIVNHARRTGEHYFHAMAHVTGIPKYRELSDVPTTPLQQQGLDPERAALDASARALAATAGISWLDACGYLMELPEVADDGSAPADTPWLDTRPLASPPRPWSSEDWERDKRRAATAGIQIGALGPDGEDAQLKALWKANAEKGNDVVGQIAEQQRADKIANHQARTGGFLDQARAREDDRRSSAINDELIRRARIRVAGNGRH